MNKDTKAFIDSYMVAALWSSLDDDGRPLDERFNRSDFDAKTRERMEAEAARFYERHVADIGAYPGRAGHDFWLTRNHHGTGFWDGDWPEEVAARLTKASHLAGEINLYAEGGKIYASQDALGELDDEEERKADALELFIDNERPLYELWMQIAKKLTVRSINRQHDRLAAVREFRILVDRGAMQYAPEYARELDRRPKRWTQEFPITVRDDVAKRYLFDFEARFKTGELEWLLDRRDKERYREAIR